jgi:hypothetical protein
MRFNRLSFPGTLMRAQLTPCLPISVPSRRLHGHSPLQTPGRPKPSKRNLNTTLIFLGPLAFLVTYASIRSYRAYKGNHQLGAHLNLRPMTRNADVWVDRFHHYDELTRTGPSIQERMTELINIHDYLIRKYGREYHTQPEFVEWYERGRGFSEEPEVQARQRRLAEQLSNTRK